MRRSIFPHEIPEDPPTQPRTLIRRASSDTRICTRCNGARQIVFHAFGLQDCPACDGTGVEDA